MKANFAFLQCTLIDSIRLWYVATGKYQIEKRHFLSIMEMREGDIKPIFTLRSEFVCLPACHWIMNELYLGWLCTDKKLSFPAFASFRYLSMVVFSTKKRFAFIGIESGVAEIISGRIGFSLWIQV